MSCPVCLSASSKLIDKLYDDRYGSEGQYQVKRCSNCRHCFVDPGSIKGDHDRIYTDHYPRNQEIKYCAGSRGKSGKLVEWINGARSSASRWVPGNVRVLDIGCGNCESLAFYQSRGCKVYGIDVDPNVKQLSIKNGFSVHIGDIKTAEYDAGYFDYVTLDQVIEHLLDPLETLKEICRVLKNDGALIISTPNPEGWGRYIFRKRWINWHIPYHVNLFSRFSMGLIARNSGFTVEQIHTITTSDWLKIQWLHLLFYPEKNHPSLFWSQASETSFFKKIVRMFIRMNHKMGVDHIITRLFDFSGVGDNHVFILRKVND